MSTEKQIAEETKAAVEETAEKTVDPYDIFNTDVEDIVAYEEENAPQSWEKVDYSKIFFEPDPDKAPNKELTYIIKFCPNIYNPRDNTPKRYTYKLPQPNNPSRTFTWISPSSENKPCPAVQAYYEFKDSSDERLNAVASTLKRKRNKIACIQILNAPSQPELNGQFRLFKMTEGFEIDTLIQNKIKPSKNDMELLDIKPVNVFDPFESPVMILRVRKGDKGRDFSASEWAPAERNQGLNICEYDENGLQVSKRPLNAEHAKNKALQEKVIELLQQEHISLKKYAMLPDEVDPEYMQKALDSIEMLRTGKAVMPTSSANESDEDENGEAELDQAVQTPKVESPKVEAKTAPSEDLDAATNEAPKAATNEAPKAETKATTAQQKTMNELFGD